MKNNTRNAVLLVILLAVIIGLRLSGIGEFLTFESLQRNKDSLLAFVRDNAVTSVLIYILVYVAAIALNLPGGAVLTIAGGFLFGTFPAVVYVNIGATCGAALAFLSARYLLGSRLQESYGTQLVKFNKEMEQNGVRYLLTLRLVPVFPFFLVNFLSGLTRVPLSSFTWTTAIGIIPGTAVFAYAGHQLETVHSVGDIFTGKVLFAFLVLGIFMVAPVIIGQVRKRFSPPSPP